MGVSLSSLVSGTAIGFDELRGRTIAIDAYNILYQFLSSIRDRFTGELLRDSNGRVTSHISGLFYRTAKLLEQGITPVLVFDGEPPAFKQRTVEQRKNVRSAAEAKWKDALRRGDVESVRVYAQGATRLTGEMIEEAKHLLGLMGVSWIQAPSEGEAQAAHMLRCGQVWAVGSQDWDSLMFGAERMVKNLTLSGRRKIPGKEQYSNVRPELIELAAALKHLGITYEQFILLGILIGTDYNPGGVKGIGPKTALKLVREKKTLEQVMGEVEWVFSITPREIYNFFAHPPAEDIAVRKETLQPGPLNNFLISHDFSENRISAAMKKLTTIASQHKQQGLGGFF